MSLANHDKNPPQNSNSFADCLIIDRPKLRALSRQLRQLYGDKKESVERQFEALLKRSQEAVLKRQNALPKPDFPEELPVNQKRDEIALAIKKHQIIIVCGETGSGKTTQLPKICLSLGLGVFGQIGHTQPRRLAARATASRIADELKSELGKFVGYKMRFAEKGAKDSYIKLMTDGILLAETESDPQLLAYDTIIIDEAHERSLNIDFLLGYLKKLLPKRPDLKVIITSATLDATRFSEHFAVNNQPAPIIEVSGRLFPVDILYRPIETGKNENAAEAENDNERDLYDAIVDACDELILKGKAQTASDILVFLPGEREIKEAAEALRKMQNRQRSPVDILPLFARLTLEEQSRIFKSSGNRRIILATNVAETSLTIPNIGYVVDSGLVRVKRYSYRNKVEQLHIEKNAQSSAKQRAGRCGRIASGVCIRLYDENDFLARPLFADPEILRASLAGVILRMKALRLGNMEDFPFLNSPPQKAINDGLQMLIELGAMDENQNLTEIGKTLAKMPLDPKIARMIIEANAKGALQEVLIIAAALCVQDPRERPQEKQGSADAAHKLFFDEKSEFLSWLKLWDWYQNAQVFQGNSATQRQIARACHDKFLSANRMREWSDTHTQLTRFCEEQNWRENQVKASFEAIHQSLLSGLLGNVGMKSEDSGHYLGARGMKFLIHPASLLNKKAGKWVIAAEITETSRLFARTIAKIDPLWIESIGAHLLKKSYFEPHWEKKAMSAVIFERSVLYGIVVNAKKRVSFASVNPAEARELFIREALVQGEITPDYEKKWAFFRHNHALMLEIEKLEHKSRRQDVLVDDELIAQFYENALPKDIVDGRSLDHWLIASTKEEREQLNLSKDHLMRHEASGITTEAFPHHLKIAGNSYVLSYHFAPGDAKDGVTLHLPLAKLNQLPIEACQWLVPGLLKEKILALCKTLPQKIRAKIVPLPDFANDFINVIDAQQSTVKSNLIERLINFIHLEKGLAARGLVVTKDAFRPELLPAHAFFNFLLIDEHGRQLDESRDLQGLREKWGKNATEEIREHHQTPEELKSATDWVFGDLPELMELNIGTGKNAQIVIGYPALIDEKTSVSLHLFDTPEEAAKAQQQGLLRLFLLQFPEQAKYLAKNLAGFNQMAMQFMSLGAAEELRAQLVELTFRRAAMNEPLPNSEATFRARCNEAKPRLGLLAQEICRLIGQILEERERLLKRLPTIKTHAETFADIEKQLAHLFPKNFILNTPFARLGHFPRYLKAVNLRVDKLKNEPARDAKIFAELRPLITNFERKNMQLLKQGLKNLELEQFSWLLEELRVQLFAQELKTPAPVSVKRLQKMWESLA